MIVSATWEWFARYESGTADDRPIAVWQEDDGGRVFGLVNDGTGGPTLVRAEMEGFRGYVHKPRH